MGRAITLALARAGADVVVLFNRSRAEAEDTVRRAAALGSDAISVRCDISRLHEVKGVVGRVEERYGKLDVLVNSADLFSRDAFPTESYDTWHRVIDTAVHGSFYVSNEFAPLLLEREAAAVVNILDLAVWQAWPNFTAHAVAKSGLLALTRQMALELAPTVRVNAVAPGSVMPMPHYSERRLRLNSDRTLLKRWGAPGDVAMAVRYLVESSYVTGEVLRVDGGEMVALRDERSGS